MDDGRVAARLRSGEYPLSVNVTYYAHGAAKRYQRLLSVAGHVRPADGEEQPCHASEDAALGMLVGRAPIGTEGRLTCNMAPPSGPPPGHPDRDRPEWTVTTFLKFDPLVPRSSPSDANDLYHGKSRPFLLVASSRATLNNGG